MNFGPSELTNARACARACEGTRDRIQEASRQEAGGRRQGGERGAGASVTTIVRPAANVASGCGVGAAQMQLSVLPPAQAVLVHEGHRTCRPARAVSDRRVPRYRRDAVGIAPTLCHETIHY